MPREKQTGWSVTDAVEKALESADGLTAFRIEQQHRTNELLQAILEELRQSNAFWVIGLERNFP